MYKKKGFTTGEVAELCHVTIPTVIKWIDNEELEGFKIPGSKNRRITRENLLKFMKKYKIPTTALEKTKLKILIVDDNAEMIRDWLDSDKYDTRTVHKGFEAGLAKEFEPDVIVLNLSLPDIPGKKVCEYLRGIPEIQHCSILAVLQNNEIEDSLLKEGFDDFVRKPLSEDIMLEKIKKLLSKSSRRKRR